LGHIKAGPPQRADGDWRADNWDENGGQLRGRSARDLIESQAEPGGPYGRKSRRRRRSLLGRKRVLFPLLLLISIGFSVGLAWWFDPTANPHTGARERQGDQLVRMANNFFAPGKSLKASFMNQQQVNVLLVGLDHVPERRGELATHRADSVLVASTDFDTKQIRILSIPRDGWVMHYKTGDPGEGDVELGYDKLGHTYANGQEAEPQDPESGVLRTKTTVEHLLGVPIDYYAVIQFEGFVEVIDALGGLDVEVEKRMKYRDRAGGLDIDLQPGLQHLSGKEVMGYARFRHDAMSDIARMGRQQKVLKLIFEELKNPANLHKLPGLVAAMNRAIQTNMTLDQLQALAQNMEEYKEGHIETQTLQSYGSNDRGLYQELPGMRRMGAQYLPPEEIEKSRIFITDLLPPPPPPPAEGEPLSGESSEWADSDAAGEVISQS
jgi:LCP family protein required for cell wall assembly